MYSWIRAGRKGKTHAHVDLTDLHGVLLGPAGSPLGFTFVMTGLLSGTRLEVRRDVDCHTGWIDLDEVTEFESDVKRVRCIDDSYVGNFVQQGKIYQVDAETRHNQYMIDGHGLLKHRFEILADEEPQAPQEATLVDPVNDHTCSQCGNTRCSKAEKACWRCGKAIVK